VQEGVGTRSHPTTPLFLCETKIAELPYHKSKQSDEAWSMQISLLMSQTVIAQPC